MLDIFQQLADTLFPPLEDVRLIRKVSSLDFSKHYSPIKLGNTTVLASYHDPLIKAAVTANKFHNYERAALLLSTLLILWQKDQGDKQTVFVPIPLSKERQKERGYNQVLRVLEATNTNNVEPLAILPLLSRPIHTKAQTSLHRTERLANMKNAFKANIPSHFPYTRVVIVDDVVTTGATMKAARETLRQALPPNVELVTLALAH